MAYRAEQISLSEIDEQLDAMAAEQYQQKLDLINMVESTMGKLATYADEYIDSELAGTHAKFSAQAEEYRSWLDRRGLINGEERA